MKLAISFDSSKIDPAIGAIWALSSIYPQTKQEVIEAFLKDLGYSQIEILFAFDLTKSRIEQVIYNNENPETVVKRGRKKAQSNDSVVDNSVDSLPDIDSLDRSDEMPISPDEYSDSGHLDDVLDSGLSKSSSKSKTKA